MFREELRAFTAQCLKANRIYDYVKEPAEEFNATEEYTSFAYKVYDRIVENGFDIENDVNIQNIAKDICNQAVKTLLGQVSHQTTERYEDKYTELLESKLGIKKPVQK